MCNFHVFVIKDIMLNAIHLNVLQIFHAISCFQTHENYKNSQVSERFHFCRYIYQFFPLRKFSVDERRQGGFFYLMHILLHLSLYLLTQYNNNANNAIFNELRHKEFF